MWSSDRRRLLCILAAAPLAACGFEPVYAPGGPAEGLFDRVRVDDPTDKNGFDLVERLEERLGRSRNPTLRLSYRITTKSTGLGITPNDTTTRYNIDGSVSYTLSRDSDKAVVMRGKVTTFVSYSAAGNIVSTRASEADAYERLMRLLADQIVNELVASSASRGPA